MVKIPKTSISNTTVSKLTEYSNDTNKAQQALHLISAPTSLHTPILCLQVRQV